MQGRQKAGEVRTSRRVDGINTRSSTFDNDDDDNTIWRVYTESKDILNQPTPTPVERITSHWLAAAPFSVWGSRFWCLWPQAATPHQCVQIHIQVQGHVDNGEFVGVTYVLGRTQKSVLLMYSMGGRTHSCFLAKVRASGNGHGKRDTLVS